jgi:transposase
MMAAPYRLELRRRIVGAYNNREGSVRALAKRFAVAPNTVENYLELLRETGSLTPRPHGGGARRRIDAQHLDEVRRLIGEMPDATVAELVQVFAQRYQIAVSRPTMARTLQRARRDA